MIIKSRYYIWATITAFLLFGFMPFFGIYSLIFNGFNSSILIITILFGFVLIAAAVEMLTYRAEYNTRTGELIIWHYFRKNYIKNPHRCRREYVSGGRSSMRSRSVVFYENGKKVGRLYIHLLIKNHDALEKEFW